VEDSKKDKNCKQKTSVSVWLSEGYKSFACISLSKEVNTETKKSIISLLVYLRSINILIINVGNAMCFIKHFYIEN